MPQRCIEVGRDAIGGGGAGRRDHVPEHEVVDHALLAADGRENAGFPEAPGEASPWSRSGSCSAVMTKAAGSPVRSGAKSGLTRGSVSIAGSGTH